MTDCMPKETDKILLGTIWIRSKGKHFNTVGTIDSIGSRGPRLKVEGETNRHNASYVRIVWAELGNQWLPNNGKAQEAYDRWSQRLALELAAEEKIMLNNMSESEEKLLELGLQVNSPVDIFTTESETEVPQENGVVTLETPEVAVKECHGAWHRGKGGTFELVPLSQFSIATRGPNKGQLGAICNDCKEKGLLSPSKKPKRVVTAPAPVVLEPKIETPEGTYYRWKVTVIQPTEHIVQAKDFLDAAAHLSGIGEIVKVEKI